MRHAVEYVCPVCHRVEVAPAEILALAPKGPLCFGPEGTDVEDASAGHDLTPMEAPNAEWRDDDAEQGVQYGH